MQLVGADIAVHLIDVGYCDARYADVVEFATALKMRLRRYVDEPRVANAARAEFKERVRGSAWRWAALCFGVE